LSSWFDDYAGLLGGQDWPAIEHIDSERARAVAADGTGRPVFTAQTPVLLADDLHYEQRIAKGRIATRENNWHDLLNALIWLRYPQIKHALNAGQVAGIAEVGTRQRTRAQCAMTHFDEGGAIVLCSDPALIALWDAHDWHGLFWRERSAWGSRIAVLVFGHAVLEHALRPDQLLVAKTIALRADAAWIAATCAASVEARRKVDARISRLIVAGSVLGDPQELRPLPLCGIPGWHAQADDEAFHREAPCFRPLRAGRIYPALHNI
jgi:hypothetical protein